MQNVILKPGSGDLAVLSLGKDGPCGESQFQRGKRQSLCTNLGGRFRYHCYLAWDGCVPDSVGLLCSISTCPQGMESHEKERKKTTNKQAKKIIKKRLNTARYKQMKTTECKLWK